MDNPVAIGKAAPPAVSAHGEPPARSHANANTDVRERFQHAMGQPLPMPAQTVFPALTSAGPAFSPPRPQSHDQVTTLLQRVCSAMYVGDSPHGSQQRVMLALDGALPGVTAQIVREGSVVSIRLRAGNEAAYRLMSLQRDALIRAVEGCGARQVVVEVTAGEGDGSIA